jgi:hypothetical protein
MKTRLLTAGGTSRMISKATTHKRTRDLEAARLVVAGTPTKLTARPVMPAATKPAIVRAKSDWGDGPKSDRRGRDAAAARAETRRENAPRQPIKAIIG